MSLGRVRKWRTERSERSFAFENASAFRAFAFFFVNSVPSVYSVHAFFNPVLDIGLDGALGVKRHGSQLLPLTRGKEVITKSSTCGLYGRLGLIIQHASTCRPTAHETNVINDCCRVFLVRRKLYFPSFSNNDRTALVSGPSLAQLWHYTALISLCGCFLITFPTALVS